MDPFKQKQVLEQYISEYLTLISKSLTALRLNQANLQIPYAQFLFSVIDYFGLLYRVADKNLYNKILKANFLEFFASNYFPATVRCKSDLIYLIRNGVMHQIFAKGISIGYRDSHELFFPDTNNGGISALNLKYLEEITISAIEAFVADLQTNSEYIDRLHDHLIIQNYGLNDHAELNAVIGKTLGGNPAKIIQACS